MNEGTVYYAKHQGIAILKLVGPFAFSLKTSRILDEFVNSVLLHEDFDNILIDLSDTHSIDSTNLGLLAMITRINMDLHDDMATIVTTNDDITQTLDGVGFHEVFHIIRDPLDPQADFQRLEQNGDADAPRTTQLVLKAHRELLQLNEKNRATFQDVVQMLEAQTRQKQD